MSGISVLCIPGICQDFIDAEKLFNMTSSYCTYYMISFGCVCVCVCCLGLISSTVIIVMTWSGASLSIWHTHLHTLMVCWEYKVPLWEMLHRTITDGRSHLSLNFLFLSHARTRTHIHA